jgi:hypothetical protein
LGDAVGDDLNWHFMVLICLFRHDGVEGVFACVLLEEVDVGVVFEDSV